MGIKGLWRLLLPIGRRISVETLEGKILAIDASIWMTQFIKAMRDPESGAVRPAAHIIGFFRRLCRLRFHGIRPVFVFDGATPDIKRREVAQRRKRRDQFVATHGAAAVQRLAKRLLVQQLQKAKAGVKTMVNGNVSIQGIATTATAENDNGAFAPGFSLPESEQQANSTTASGNTNADNDGTQKRAAQEVIDLEDDNSRFEFKNGEVIITSHLNNSKPALSQADADAAGNNDDEADAEDNDWDKPINVDEMDESDGSSSDPKNEVVEYDDVLWSSRPRRKKRKKKHPTKSNQNSDEFFDSDYVLSLAPADRKDAIELAKKKQRLKSRTEFMPVAANAMEYSQAQVRNFLRSTQLNKNIVAMAKQAVRVDSKKNGEVMASDRTRRVIFEKDNDDETTANNNNKGDDSSSSSSSSSDSDSDDSSESEDDGDFLRAKERPTKARRMQSKQRQNQSPPDEEPTRRRRLRKVLGNIGLAGSTSEDDSEDAEGGGFFSQPAGSGRKEESPAAKEAVRRSKRRVVIDDGDDSDEEEGGGGFLPVTVPAPADIAKQATEESEESDGGGGFMSAVPAVTTKPNVSDVSGEGGFVRSEDNLPAITKKCVPSSSAAAKRVQFDDSEDSSDGGGFMDAASSSDKKLSRPKSLREMAYSAKAAKAIAGSLFRSSANGGSYDDDSSEDGGGFLRGKPVVSRARLKSTGLDNEVIVIDDNDGHDGTVETRLLSGDAMKAQELQDQLFARALQEEEDAHIAASYAESGFNDRSASDEGPINGIAGDQEVAMGNKELIIGSPESSIAGKHRSDNDHPAATVTANNSKTAAPSPLMLAGDDELEDEDIAWENGDASGDENERIDGDFAAGEEESAAEKETISPGVGARVKASPTTGAVETSQSSGAERSGQMQASSECDDNDSDSVAWEDGDATANNPMVEIRNEMEQVNGENSSQNPVSSQRGKNTESAPGQLSTLDNVADDASIHDAEMAFADSRGGLGESSLGMDDFGGHHKADNVAALEQAEATASNLTNWAGRAVRRAIADHLGAEGVAKTPERPGLQNPEAGQGESDESVVEVVQHDVISAERKGDENAAGQVEEHELVVNEEYAEEAAELLQNYQTELSQAPKNNVEREIDGVTDEMQEEIKQLLQLFGVPYVEAPAEAEAQCVALEKLGLVHGIVTEDSDVFVFGGKTIFKNIFDDQKYAEVYKANDAEREMGLGQNEMVALAMLLGGDYTEGVKGVGIVNGMEIVSSFDVSDDLKAGLQKFRTWLDGFEPIVEAKSRKNPGAKSRTKEQKFHIKHRTARNRWNAPENFPSDTVISAYANPVVDKSKQKFSFGVPDMENLITFCNKQIGWPAEQTMRLLEPVIGKVKSTTRQTRIDSFMTYEDGIKFANVNSKRLRHVLGAVQKEGEGERDEESGMEEESSEKLPVRKKRKKSAGKPKAAKRKKS